MDLPGVPGTGNQVAISAMLVLALGSSSPEYAIARIGETLIGVVIGIVVNALIVPPVLVEPARRDVGLLDGSSPRASTASRTPCPPRRLRRGCRSSCSRCGCCDP